MEENSTNMPPSIILSMAFWEAHRNSPQGNAASRAPFPV